MTVILPDGPHRDLTRTAVCRRRPTDTSSEPDDGSVASCEFESAETTVRSRGRQKRCVAGSRTPAHRSRSRTSYTSRTTPSSTRPCTRAWGGDLQRRRVRCRLVRRAGNACPLPLRRASVARPEPPRDRRPRDLAVVPGAHRASTGTAVQQTNRHPFRYGRWLWVHNGLSREFRTVKRDLMLAVDPPCFTVPR